MIELVLEVNQDNYYGAEINRMLTYLHTYPVEVIFLCPDVETIKERKLPQKQDMLVLRLKSF